MRKTILTAMALALAMAANAATEQGDSIKRDTLTVEKAKSVTVIKEKNGTIKVNVDGKKGDADYHLNYQAKVEKQTQEEWTLNMPFLKNSTNKWHYAMGGLYVGAVFPHSSCKANLDLGLEIGARQLVGAQLKLSEKGPQVRLGLGFGVTMLYGKDPSERFARPNMALITEPFPEGAYEKRCTMGTAFFNTNTELMQRFGKHGFVSLSAMLRYNAAHIAMNQYKLSGTEYTERIFGLRQRYFTPEFQFTTGWRNLAVYVKYSPVGLFKEHMGPSVTNFSVGVSFFNF